MSLSRSGAPAQMIPSDRTPQWEALDPVDADCRGYLQSRGLEAAANLCRSVTERSPGELAVHAQKGFRLAVAMRSGSGQVVAIQLRRIDGEKGFRTVGPSGVGVFGEPRAIAEAKTVVIAEGMTDFLAASLALREVPRHAAIGIAGASAVRAVQNLELARKHVFLAMDADEAGDHCAEELAASLTARGATCYRARPDGVKDLAELHEQSASLIELFDAADPLGPVGREPTRYITATAREDWQRPLPPAVQTGIGALDRAIGGLRAGGTYLLAGPTGRGKSGLAIQIARHIGASRPVLYLSTELSRRQIEARIAAQVLQLSWVELYDLGPSETGLIAEAVARLAIAVVEVGRETDWYTEADAITKAEGAPPILVVDYLHGIARRLGLEPRAAAGRVSDEITTWVRERETSALVLASVSRPWHAAPADRVAEDFVTAAKDAGELEYDASAVLFLEAEQCPPGGTAAARLHVAKSRFGGAGMTIGLRFNGALGTFAEDRAAVLTKEQQATLDAIRQGATSVDEVRKALQIKKERASELVNALAARGAVTRRPLTVQEGW